MTDDDISDSRTPQSADELKRRIENGECFMWEYYNRRLYFEWVETVGVVRTETDEHGNEPHTTAAYERELETAVAPGYLERIDHEDIPAGDDADA
jgi:hypothetical protein